VQQLFVEESVMRSYILAVSLVLTLLVPVACVHNPAGTGPGSPVVIERDIAASVHAFQTAEISLHQQGKISNRTHRTIQADLKKVAQAGDAVNNVLGQPSAGAAIDAGILSVLQMINEGILPIGDATTRQELQLAAQLIITTFNNIRAFSSAP